VGLVSNFGSTALRYGSAFHEAMDGFYTAVKEFGWNETELCMEAAILSARASWDSEENAKFIFTEDYRNFNNLMSALMLYMGHFKDDKNMIEIVDSERYFEIDLEVTRKERAQHGLAGDWVIFTGIIDLEILLSDRYWSFDFKTTGRDLNYAASNNERSFQFKGYTFAGSKTDRTEPDGMIVLYHQILASKSKKTGEYGTLKLDFKRVPYMYTPWDLEKWRESFLETYSRVARCYETDRWPQQDDHCFKYGRCQYIDFCMSERYPAEFEDRDVPPPYGFHFDEPWNPGTAYDSKQTRRKAIIDALKERKADGNP
jgi:hypothetical protein